MGGGGGVPQQKIFFWSEHVSSQIWCQKFFPLLGRGVPRQKIFFLVWTCIKPNLVSKILPFTETRYPPPDLRLGPPHLDLGPLPDLGPGTPPNLRLGTPPPGPGTPPLPPTWTWTWDPPPGPGIPLPGPGPRTPPPWTWTWDPPRNVNRQTPVKTVPSRHTTYAGGNNRNLIAQPRSLYTYTRTLHCETRLWRS